MSYLLPSPIAFCFWSGCFSLIMIFFFFFFFFQAEDGIRDHCVTGVQTCALPISNSPTPASPLQASIPSRTISGSIANAATGSAHHHPSAAFKPRPRSVVAESHAQTMVSCARSEEHTSELQSHSDLVCRLLLEKKK